LFDFLQRTPINTVKVGNISKHILDRFISQRESINLPNAINQVVELGEQITETQIAVFELIKEVLGNG
jgi:hypothetical protein